MLLKIQESTGRVPVALESKPELTRVQHYYLGCFSELSKCRRYTESGPLPLSIAEIRDYYQVFELIDFEALFDWLTTIDSIWLEEVSNKSRKATSKSGSGNQNAEIPPAPR